MALRSTQSYVTTLDRAAGKLRATQSYVAVLTGEIVVSQVASNSLSLESLAAIPTFVACDNSLSLESLVTHNFVFLDCGDSLSLSADIGLDYETDITQFLGWTPRTILACSNTMFSDEEGLPPPQTLTQAFVHTVSNDFNLVAAIIQAYNVENVFLLDETVLNTQAFSLFNEFIFTPTVTQSGPLGRDDVQGVLKQHLSFSIAGDKCLEKNYKPLVGSGGDPTYEAINTTPPTLTPSTLTLTYPFVSPTNTLVLKNPRFGNTNTFARAAIYRKTRGGDEHIAADASWPTTDIESFEIENLCSADVSALVDFLNASLGKLVGLLDWEGRQWSGLILTPDTKISQTGRNSWSFSLAFQKS